MSEARLASAVFQDDAMWLRGNLHVHTTLSDGRCDPQELIEAYAELGHDFLALTDHDVLSTLDGLDGCGMVLLGGNEVSGNGPHLLDLGAKMFVEPHPDRQRVIDRIVADSGFAVLCHPNWMEEWNHYSFEALMRLEGYVGIEIFNGLVLDQAGSHLAVDKWERLLSAGKVVWGFATDDAHSVEQFGRGWSVVRTPERTADAILEALRTGSFYASTGVEIETVTCEGPELVVVAPNAEAFNVFKTNGARIGSAQGPELRFDVTDVMSRYIRVECYGRAGATAWLQPMLIRGGRYERLLDRFAELQALERPVLHVLHADDAPRLTGNVDHPLWDEAERSANFLRMRDGEPSDVKTEVSALATRKTVTVAVRCEEPRLDDLRLKTTADNLSSIWADDSVELFIDVGGRGDDYIQVLVNAAGKCCVLAPKRGEYLDPGIEAKAGRIPGGWSVEVALPLKVLGASADRGTRWGFHVCRNRKAVPETLVWSWVGSSNHQPTRFGSLVF